MSAHVKPDPAMPPWLPEAARLYLHHIEGGVPIRELARAEGCHASTVLRRVRRLEARRDDPLVDEMLNRLGRREDGIEPPAITDEEKDIQSMTAPIRSRDAATDQETIEREARRILRRLSEPGALLAIAADLDKAVVMRGELRTAVLPRAVAQAFALNDWIQLTHGGRVSTYAITASGRAALRRLLAAESAARPAGFAEAQGGFTPFAEQHRIWGDAPRGEPGMARARINLAESPLGILARRRDKDGVPFLTPDLVAAGERLREDFELAQMGPRIAQNWERFMTGADRGSFRAETGGGGGSERARDRVAAALRDLGPGLGDMVLRCCCFLEGLEAAEKRLGWSARSGKIVLRIALMRLKRHYDETYGGAAPLIG